ncbi:hypothetical protein PROFUN_13501 [Planoprotostelium fungivorum]|uniref:Uncharacterized protein n=1 Tax=Planoprotostelium fungivorum TaxID=1890364 RepID=A0A2P6N3T3_9EUKA|nr:hypothetical protein PROFUN_13501 [Planoprotostelium fungivorum]
MLDESLLTEGGKIESLSFLLTRDELKHNNENNTAPEHPNFHMYKSDVHVTSASTTIDSPASAPKASHRHHLEDIRWIPGFLTPSGDGSPQLMISASQCEYSTCRQ